MAVQGCPLPTASEEESGAAGPARPLPSMQTFAFQTQMRRCRASGRAGGGASSTPLALRAPTPAPCFHPSDHLRPHRLRVCHPLPDLPAGLASPDWEGGRGLA